MDSYVIKTMYICKSVSLFILLCLFPYCFIVLLCNLAQGINKVLSYLISCSHAHKVNSCLSSDDLQALQELAERHPGVITVVQLGQTPLCCSIELYTGLYWFILTHACTSTMLLQWLWY